MIGDWITTYSGRKFYPLDPRPEDICLEDIAHALSLTCRYNGHSREFYSVAEHSVRMSWADLFGSPQWQLMHDAAEAYLSDVPKPIKPMLPEFRAIEDRILAVIGGKYGLGPFPKDDIHRADLVMLATEKRDVLMPGAKWDLELPAPLPDIIYPFGAEEAEREFFRRCGELGIADRTC